MKVLPFEKAHGLFEKGFLLDFFFINDNLALKVSRWVPNIEFRKHIRRLGFHTTNWVLKVPNCDKLTFPGSLRCRMEVLVVQRKSKFRFKHLTHDSSHAVFSAETRALVPFKLQRDFVAVESFRVKKPQILPLCWRVKT